MSTVDKVYPYQIHFDHDRYHQIREIIDWCLENIGEGGYIGNKQTIWAVATAFGKSSWLFKKKTHATLFALRWA
jgi:hypothetical protein